MKEQKRTLNSVYIALGSNINKEKNIKAALERLKKKLTILAKSKVYETDPIGTNYPEPKFLNAVIKVETPLDPSSLKSQILQPIEIELGRVRTTDKNAPRPIDLDILIFNKITLADDIHLPHNAVPLKEITRK